VPDESLVLGERVKRNIVAILCSLAGIGAAHAQGKVHPNPAIPCSSGDFKPHELCFQTPQDGVARVEYLSESFYAILLKSADRCTIAEEERLRAQELFPQSKVFSMRIHCDENIEENISYTNVNEEFGFLAVYAGRTWKEAKARLAEVKATGRFPGANIRKMQARLVYP
jgi:hypothetical protein